MADKVLGVRDRQSVGKHWAERLGTRSNKLRQPSIELRIGKGYCRKILR